MKLRPSALWEKLKWHANDRLCAHPGLLGGAGATLSVIDAFGTPGDTLLTAVVCRELKTRYRRLKINCITPNPGLLTHDPHIDSLNGPLTFFHIRSWYLDVMGRKDGETNILSPTLAKLGIRDYNYQARVYLTPAELEAGRARIASLPRPIITINAMSRERSKTWPEPFWQESVRQLVGRGSVVQLGDDKEPVCPGVIRLAGALSMRESMAVLAHADVHVGSVSFLMHVANGLDVPAVIIFGGRETPKNSGYAQNINLYSKTECSPCWLHDSHGDHCPYEVKCMQTIPPQTVIAAVDQLLAQRRTA